MRKGGNCCLQLTMSFFNRIIPLVDLFQLEQIRATIHFTISNTPHQAAQWPNKTNIELAKHSSVFLDVRQFLRMLLF